MKIIQTNDYELIAKLNKPVHDLHCSLYPTHFTPYNYRDMKELFSELMGNPTFIFLLVQENKEAVGYAWIEVRNHPENPLIRGYQSIYVHQLSVVDSKRKKGYGSKLLAHIYQVAKAREISIIELDYWADNQIAKQFYQKHKYINIREFVYKKI